MPWWLRALSCVAAVRMEAPWPTFHPRAARQPDPLETPFGKLRVLIHQHSWSYAVPQAENSQPLVILADLIWGG